MIANELPTSQRLFIAMNKLLLTSILLISVGSLCGMEKEIQLDDPFIKHLVNKCGEKELKLSPITLSQIYYQFSHELLLPEIAQHIFSLQCGKSDLAEMEQKCKSPRKLVGYIKTLISSSGYLLASEVCECFFKHKKISICDIRDKHQQTCLHLSYYDPKVIQILLNIAYDKVYELLTMQCSGGWTILHFAADTNNAKMIKLLLGAAGNNAYALIAMQNRNGCTALYFAVDHNNLEIVKLLLATAGEKAPNLIMTPNNYGKTALDIATPQIKKLMQTYMTNK